LSDVGGAGVATVFCALTVLCIGAAAATSRLAAEIMPGDDTWLPADNPAGIAPAFTVTFENVALAEADEL
jgi:hypothetical protein